MSEGYNTNSEWIYSTYSGSIESSMKEYRDFFIVVISTFWDISRPRSNCRRGCNGRKRGELFTYDPLARISGNRGVGPYPHTTRYNFKTWRHYPSLFRRAFCVRRRGREHALLYRGIPYSREHRRVPSYKRWYWVFSCATCYHVLPRGYPERVRHASRQYYEKVQSEEIAASAK